MKLLQKIAIFLALIFLLAACSNPGAGVDANPDFLPADTEEPDLVNTDIEENHFDAALLENQPGTLPYTPDLNHNGIPETMVRAVEEDDRGRIEVWEEDKLLWPKSTTSELYGQCALFLCTLDGEDYLLNYNPIIGRWNAGYNYQLIDVKYSAKPLRENSVSFDLNYGVNHQSFDPAEIAAFMEELNGLLENCVPLWITYPELSDTFVKEGRLVDTLWWLDYFPETFTRDENAALLENLERFQSVRFQEIPEPEPVSWESAEDAKAAYLAILEDGGSFLNTASGKYQDLTKWHREYNDRMEDTKALEFSFLDFDEDGTPEAVAYMDIRGGAAHGGYIILHYQDGAVYGYQVYYRSMEDLKADGTFSFSGGVTHCGFSRIRFIEADEYPVMEIEDFAYYMADTDESGEFFIEYYVNNKLVDAEEYERFCEPYRESAGAIWYELADIKSAFT